MAKDDSKTENPGRRAFLQGTVAGIGQGREQRQAAGQVSDGLWIGGQLYGPFARLMQIGNRLARDPRLLEVPGQLDW